MVYHIYKCGKAQRVVTVWLVLCIVNVYTNRCDSLTWDIYQKLRQGAGADRFTSIEKYGCAMADLAEPIDDLICSFDGNTDFTMDTLAMLIFGWILVALFVLWMGKLLYARFILKETTNETKPKVEVAKVEVQSVEVTENAKSVKKSAPVVTAAKSTSGGGGVGGGGGSGGYVPPTPPIRKRLSRKSPVPDLKRIHHTPAPQCTGADHVSVQWVNDVFQWLYNDLVIVNEILNVWIQSLNEVTKQAVSEHGVGVDFIRILPETLPPALTNLFCECDSKDDVTITCDCEATPAMQVKCSRQKGEKVETSHYRVNVNRFRARLNVLCVTEKLQAELKCDGWPDIKISLAQVGNIKNNDDEPQLQDVISEIVITAMRNTLVHLNLAQYPTCPRLTRNVGSPGYTLPVHYDSMTGAQFTSTPNHKSMGRDRRLLVKVVRAAQLGADQGCIEPFCVVEMDEPPQKNQTSIKRDTHSPEWDEHFLFDLTPNTAELLFEVYDRATKPHRFLGLGIVGVEELLINPSQRQIIALQTRPYESDAVSGTITVEFLFIEGADIPTLGDRPFKLKETLRTVSPTGTLITTTKTTFANGESLTNGENLTDSALKELERSRQGANTNKSTLIIHSVQRQPSQRLKVELVEGAWKEVTPNPETEIDEKPGEPHLENHDNNATLDSIQSRGRARKKRDFFGTIKRRLGRSKTRSRSAGPGDNDFDPDNSLARSVSADRARDANESNGLRLNVPGLRSMDENSRRSSLSEASGLSGASTRTYINEASTLVLETLENGVKRHYLVPLSLAQKSKWRKKGTKLHIFNDHTFIAKHLPGGTVCQVCNKSIARRLGKQGYECRDCQLKCHKHCHVKCNDNCPTSTIHNIELSYITNPYTVKNIRIEQNLHDL
ncbi:uncharacterized protein CBL_03343 [Carabus blaptoides fortunei]